jgi:dihydroorotate dehydrogenase
MGWPYRTLIRPWLFAQDAEAAHNRALSALASASRQPLACGLLQTVFGASPLPVEVFGLKFPNPVGLAAGMDKQAAAIPAWAALGFGFSELGGVTWQRQPGNPQPRMFRAVAEQAIVNRMGFNNGGAESLAHRLGDWKNSGRWPGHPVGINLGKSKVTPLNEAARDYASSFRVLRDLADFFVVNVSSPNTPNLRQLQDKAALDEILAALQEQNTTQKPILVKVSPDLTLTALDEMLELAGPRRLAGFVATNTTVTRPVKTDAAAQKVYAETGGLSGKPLRDLSNLVIHHLHRQTKGQLPIIGVGGIFTAADAWEKITAGASLVQIYTGLVYEGPGLTKTIVTGLTAHFHASGAKDWSQAVGSGNHRFA